MRLRLDVVQADPPVLQVLVLLQAEDGPLWAQQLSQLVDVLPAPGLAPAEEGREDLVEVKASLRLVLVGVCALPSHLPAKDTQRCE